MRLFKCCLLACIALLALAIQAQSVPSSHAQNSELELHKASNYHYGYINREFTFNESLRHVGFLYAVTWAVYPATQPDTVRKKGSFQKYRNNFGRIVFDQDEPFWNWFVHPYSGSQLFLTYRALGYSRPQAMGMAFISSALFEFTVEIYTEPASVQDLYQTPVLGSILGLGIEHVSMYLLNAGNPVGKVIGHLLNPATLLWFYEGKVRITPAISNHGIKGFNLMAEF